MRQSGQISPSQTAFLALKTSFWACGGRLLNPFFPGLGPTILVFCGPRLDAGITFGTPEGITTLGGWKGIFFFCWPLGITTWGGIAGINFFCWPGGINFPLGGWIGKCFCGPNGGGGTTFGIPFRGTG